MIQPVAFFTDSCDHYADAQLANKYGGTANLFNAHITANGRNGQGISAAQGFIVPGGVRVVTFASAGSMQFNIGFAYNLEQSSGTSANAPILSGIDQSGITVITLTIASDNTLYLLTGGSAPVVIGVGPILQQNTWYYIEVIMQVAFPDPVKNPNDPIVCSGALMVDGKVWFNVSSANGGFQAHIFPPQDSLNQFVISSSGQAGTVTIDDIYVINATLLNLAFDVSSLFGDVSVQCSYPEVDIANVNVGTQMPPNWNPLPLVSNPHFSLVDDHPPDFDVSFIFFTAQTAFIQPNALLREALDTYNFNPVTMTDKIFGVNSLYMYGITGQVDSENISFAMGSVNTSPPSYFFSLPLGTAHVGYQWQNYFNPTDPYDGVPWTPAIYNNGQIGVLYPITAANGNQ